MANESFTFACPVCQTRLTIPVQFAGIVGACPSCNTRIKAPPAPQQQTLPASSPPSSPTHQPQYRPAPVSSTGANTPYQRQPSNPAPPARYGATPHNQSRSRSQRHSHRNLFRFLILPLLLAFVAITCGAYYFLNKKPQPPVIVHPKPPATVAAPDSPAHPPNVDDPEKSQATTDKRLGIIAQEIVEKFCQANTLEERLPILETTESSETLAQTPLAGPLSALKIQLLGQEHFKRDQITDFHFRVFFRDANGRTNPQSILVRKRGDAEPKVVAAPFLDLYGGRLAAFTSQPSDKGTGATFYAVVYALGSCTDQEIPDRANKFTLRLLSVEGGNEIARSYFGKNSRIGQMLTDGTYDLKYGEYLPCTVYLTWNTTKGKPYLEALQIKSLNWNP